MATRATRAALRNLMLAAGIAFVWPGIARGAQHDQPPAAANSATGGKTTGGHRKSWRVAGAVYGPRGSAVAGAQVTLFGWTPWPGARGLENAAWTIEQTAQSRLTNVHWNETKVLRKVLTDKAGCFVIETSSDSEPLCLVAVSSGLAFGYQAVLRRFRESPDQRLENVQIRLSKEARICGRILTADGKPARGTLVFVRQMNDSVAEPPTWDVVTCQCHIDVSRGVSLEEVDKHLPEFWPRSVVTDEDGHFELKGVPAGCIACLTLAHRGLAKHALIVDMRPGRTPTNSDWGLHPVPQEFMYTLSADREAKGVVKAADTGRPIPDVLVQIASLPYHSSFWHGAGGVYCRTDQQGRFRGAGHVLESRNIAVYPPARSGYLGTNHYAKHADIKEDRPVEIRLARGSLVHGKVWDAETDKPIAGASVLYRPARASPAHGESYHLFTPVLTDGDGRFVLTAPAGPGYLMAETTDRSYLRSRDARQLLQGVSDRPVPAGLTTIEVPVPGTGDRDVLIRLRRGRRVVLDAVGAAGERLPWVLADWEGGNSSHDFSNWCMDRYPDGKVAVQGLDPKDTIRVFLLYPPSKLGSVFDIPPGTAEGPIVVRLKPTAALTGQVVRAGKPEKRPYLSVWVGYDPKPSEYLRGHSRPYAFYEHLVDLEHGRLYRVDPGGKFTIEYLLPDVPIALSYGTSGDSSKIIDVNMRPLAAGERRNLGQLEMEQGGVMKRLWGILRRLAE